MERTTIVGSGESSIVGENKTISLHGSATAKSKKSKKSHKSKSKSSSKKKLREPPLTREQKHLNKLERIYQKASNL